MTKVYRDILSLSQEVNAAVQTHSGVNYGELHAGLGELAGMDGFILQYAAVYAPEPIGIAHIFSRVPYSNPDKLKRDLSEANERGWLEPVDDGVYTVSHNGQTWFDRLVDSAKQDAQVLAKKTKVNIERGLEITQRVLDGAEHTQMIADKPGMVHSVLFREKEGDVLPFYRFRSNLIEFSAYRDDCHVAAWRTKEVEGYVWEAFALLADGEIKSSKALLEKRPNRGYLETDYDTAFHELVESGWLHTGKNGHTLTGQGKLIRQEVENLTDEYFAAAFEELAANEVQELNAMLEQMKIEFAGEAVLQT